MTDIAAQPPPVPSRLLPLLETLDRELHRLDVATTMSAFNDGEIGIGITAHDAARLTIALRQASTRPADQEANDLLFTLVNSPDGTGG